MTSNVIRRGGLLAFLLTCMAALLILPLTLDSPRQATNALAQDTWQTYDDTAPGLTYGNGVWEQYAVPSAWAGTLTGSLAPGATLTAFFEGTGIRLVYASGPEGNSFTGQLDTYPLMSATSHDVAYSYGHRMLFEDLPSGLHSLTLTNGAGAIWIDAVEVQGQLLGTTVDSMSLMSGETTLDDPLTETPTLTPTRDPHYYRVPVNLEWTVDQWGCSVQHLTPKQVTFPDTMVGAIVQSEFTDLDALDNTWVTFWTAQVDPNEYHPESDVWTDGARIDGNSTACWNSDWNGDACEAVGWGPRTRWFHRIAYGQAGDVRNITFDSEVPCGPQYHVMATVRVLDLIFYGSHEPQPTLTPQPTATNTPTETPTPTIMPTCDPLETNTVSGQQAQAMSAMSLDEGENSETQSNCVVPPTATPVPTMTPVPTTPTLTPTPPPTCTVTLTEDKNWYDHPAPARTERFGLVPDPYTSPLGTFAAGATIELDARYQRGIPGPESFEQYIYRVKTIDGAPAWIYLPIDPTSCPDLQWLDIAPRPDPEIESVLEEIRDYGVDVQPTLENGSIVIPTGIDSAWSVEELNNILSGIELIQYAYLFYSEIEPNQKRFRVIMTPDDQDYFVFKRVQRYECDAAIEGGRVIECGYMRNPSAPTSGPYWAPNGVLNMEAAIHEMGHVFDSRSGGQLQLMVGAASILNCVNVQNNNMASSFVLGDIYQNGSWERGQKGWGDSALAANGNTQFSQFQQNPYSPADQSEAAADMFLNWVYRWQDTTVLPTNILDEACSAPATGSWSGFQNIGADNQPNTYTATNGQTFNAMPGNRRYWWMHITIGEIFDDNPDWQ